MAQRIFQILPLLLMLLLPIPTTAAVNSEPGQAFLLQSGLHIGTQLKLFEDKSNTVQFADVLAGLNLDRFNQSKSQFPNFGFTQATVFGFTDFHVTVEAGGDWLLELNHPLIDSIKLKIKSLNAPAPGENIDFVAGDLLPFEHRPINHRNFIFPIQLQPGLYRLYFAIKSSSSILADFTFWRANDFLIFDLDRQILLGCFYGIMIVMILYNAILAGYMRSLTTIFYVLYLISFTTMQAALDGILYQRLLSHWTFLNNIAMPFFGSFALTFAGLFMYQFLELSKSKKYMKWIMYFIILYAFSGIFISLTLGYYRAVRYINVAGFSMPMIAIIFGFIRLKQNFWPALYFLMGFGILSVGSLVFAASRAGLMPTSLFTYHSQQIGAALEAIMLSFALSARMRFLQRAREEAQLATIEQQKKLNASFARFVPTSFLNMLGKKSIPEVALGDYTESRMAILFADIRSFTSLAEKMTPKQTFEFINNYLRSSGPVIRKHSGFIDKYMGDGIMALFQRSEDAIQAALRLQQRNAKLNRFLRRSLAAPLKIGIGIHTGHLMLGTIGEPQRMDGTVISDAVNLASRIESLTKQYGVDVLVTGETLADSTVNERPAIFQARFMDRIAVMGKEASTEIFEVWPNGSEPAKYSPSWLAVWREATTHYYARKFDVALELFEELLKTIPQDKPAQVFVQRCRKYLADGPSPTWNGVEFATAK